MRRNLWFIGASIMALVTLLVHCILGGAEIVGPLFAAEQIEGVVRYTLYYCWHLVTIALAVMVIAFLHAALSRDAGVRRTLGRYATGVALAFAVLDLMIIVRFGLSPVVHGQWMAFAIIGALGGAGLVWLGDGKKI